MCKEFISQREIAFKGLFLRFVDRFMDRRGLKQVRGFPLQAWRGKRGEPCLGEAKGSTGRD